MTTLTSANTFPIADGTIAQASADLLVLPIAAPGEGTGRLVHPTLGTYDYAYPPDEWVNLDTDVLVPPVWASERTLAGNHNTLWPGHIGDVVCVERWTSDIALRLEMLRMLLALWQNPPDPETGAYLAWYPSYTSALGYKVAMLAVTVGGQEITLDYLTRQGWARGPIEVRYKVIGYAD